MTQQQGPMARSPGGPQTKTGQGKFFKKNDFAPNEKTMGGTK
jgi:hypothetical protein